MKKFNTNGFTLAEVLITLGVIGVVAALTIPALLTHLNHIKLQSQFKEGYSILSRMIKEYNADDERGTLTNDQKFYKNFMKYFNSVTDCGDALHVAVDSKYCINRVSSDSSKFNRDEQYTNYSKTTNSINTVPLDDGQFYLQNGMLITFDITGTKKISIDINGKSQKPNAWGHDLFTFELHESDKEGGYELVPMGATNTPYHAATYCNKNNTDSILNGIGCAYYALTDNTYFKKLP